MRVMEWNVHGLASNRCPTYVANEINRLGADIVVLTEYVENANYDGTFEKALQSFNYLLFRQPKVIKGNGVLIAAKQNSEIKIDCSKCIYSICNGKEKLGGPDFLKVSIEYLGMPITIIGLRVNTDTDYQNRWKQVKQVLLFIANLPEEYQDRIIVIGDFNNSQIKGVENDFYEVNQYIGYDTEKYNLQMIKKAFKEAGFYVSNSTPKGNVFKTFSQLYKNFPYKHDHIFVKGMNISNTEYDWSYKEQEYIRDVGRKPDHAILRAELEI